MSRFNLMHGEVASRLMGPVVTCLTLTSSIGEQQIKINCLVPASFYINFLRDN